MRRESAGLPATFGRAAKFALAAVAFAVACESAVFVDAGAGSSGSGGSTGSAASQSSDSGTPSSGSANGGGGTSSNGAGASGAGGSGGSGGTCAGPQDCPDPGNPCVERTCVGQTCGTQNLPSGDLCEGTRVCDGDGTCVDCVVDDNCPSGTDPECTAGHCKADNTCEITNAALDTGCQTTQFCDGNGACVECNDNPQCTGAGEVCVNNLCAQPHCTNGAFDSGVESDQDCGVACGPTCITGQNCFTNEDCVSDLCDPTLLTCADCLDATDCATNLWCSDGRCIGKLGNGTSCPATEACISGHCVGPTGSQFCCDSACDQACESCVAPTFGTCTAVAAGSPDPNGICVEDISSCRKNACLAAGACDKYTNNETCAPATCTGGVLLGESRCDAGAICQSSGSTTCIPYNCDLGGLSCFQDCTGGGTADCAPGYVCNGASETCLGALGTPCYSTADCDSTFCIDGVCCDSFCAGVCRTCAGGFPNTIPGQCGAITRADDPSGGQNCMTVPNGRLCDTFGNCKLANGMACANDPDCATGYCAGTTCAACQNDFDCPGPPTCDVPSGFCN